jgi:hypothetical protein
MMRLWMMEALMSRVVEDLVEEVQSTSRLGNAYMDENRALVVVHLLDGQMLAVGHLLNLMDLDVCEACSLEQNFCLSWYFLLS